MRRLLGLVSGGKDSLYALFLAYLHSFEVVALGTVRPRSGTLLFHEPNIDFVKIHSELLDLPLIEVRGWEEEALLELFCRAKEEYNVNWVSVGALASDFQRLRFVWTAADCGLKVYAPLWHLDPQKYLRMLVEDGFRFVIVSAGVFELKDWVGKEVGKENVEELIALAERHRFHPAGEGGEYESFVVDAPLFPKRIRVAGERRDGIFYIRRTELAAKE
ncbi:MAG: diphthine--ammonia ligase [Candidatus Diapherotrites archaeon]|nr:diphthine--ammonia ligase [Candidatus Diapherotrites archaeon]